MALPPKLKPLPPYPQIPIASPGGEATQAYAEYFAAADKLIRTLLNGAVFDYPAISQNGLPLGSAAFANVGTAAGEVVALDAGDKLPAVDGSQLTGLPSQSGRLVAGTPLVKNPWVNGAIVTQAHALGAQPTFLSFVFQCLSAELNYSIGDQVVNMSAIGIYAAVIASPVNLTAVLANAAPFLLDKSTAVGTNITPSKWKLIITPYKLS
jgi:hypothetical protein